MGLPYAFASHFAPGAMEQALGLYRQGFRPSKRLAKPQVMLALNVVGADSEAAARYLFTTQQQSFVRLRRGGPGLVPPPRSEEHTSELQSLMRISYAVFCLTKKKQKQQQNRHKQIRQRHTHRE